MDKKEEGHTGTRSRGKWGQRGDNNYTGIKNNLILGECGLRVHRSCLTNRSNSLAIYRWINEPILFTSDQNFFFTNSGIDLVRPESVKTLMTCSSI